MSQQKAPKKPSESQQFEAEVLALTPALQAFARRLSRNSYDTDDLVQETLFKAFRYREYFQPGTKLRSWLFTIMRNNFNSQYVLRRREPVSVDECLDLLPVSMPSQDWTLYEHDAQRQIDALPSSQRAALIQICAGASYEDAARSMGCEIGTIKSRVGRARKTLLASMGDIFTTREIYAQ
jgi:RNA polymerase sigma-70 factor (ECF subfamily)